MRRWLWIGIALALAAPPLGWVVTDELESHDSFCVACHLDAETPLHQSKLRDFRAESAVNLASYHARHVEGGMRCITCHGGASFWNKLRVKTIAGRDAVSWLIGAFDEPNAMTHPLWDEDCTQCHDRYEAERDDDFHAIADHNVAAFEVRCVSCHTSHPTDGAPELSFLQRDRVAETCKLCHEEL